MEPVAVFHRTPSPWQPDQTPQGAASTLDGIFKRALLCCEAQKFLGDREFERIFVSSLKAEKELDEERGALLFAYTHMFPGTDFICPVVADTPNFSRFILRKHNLLESIERIHAHIKIIDPNFIPSILILQRKMNELYEEFFTQEITFLRMMDYQQLSNLSTFFEEIEIEVVKTDFSFTTAWELVAKGILQKCVHATMIGFLQKKIQMLLQEKQIEESLRFSPLKVHLLPFLSNAIQKLHKNELLYLINAINSIYDNPFLFWSLVCSPENQTHMALVIDFLSEGNGPDSTGTILEMLENELASERLREHPAEHSVEPFDLSLNDSAGLQPRDLSSNIGLMDNVNN